MVYRQPSNRHSLPAAAGPARQTDKVVEDAPDPRTHLTRIPLLHPEAVALNRLHPPRATQVDLDQPGLHANARDWTAQNGEQAGPAVPVALPPVLLRLAGDIRLLDTCSQPVRPDLLGQEPVKIKTPEGKAEYVPGSGVRPPRVALRAGSSGSCDELLGPALPRGETRGRGPAQQLAGQSGSPRRSA
ncbi:hypothetical protein GCM10020358_26430 [Amorphoplanes nipponensis]